MPELTDVKGELQFSAEVKLSKMDWDDLKHGSRVVLTLHVPGTEINGTKHPIAVSLGIAISQDYEGMNAPPNKPKPRGKGSVMAAFSTCEKDPDDQANIDP